MVILANKAAIEDDGAELSWTHRTPLHTPDSSLQESPPLRSLGFQIQNVIIFVWIHHAAAATGLAGLQAADEPQMSNDKLVICLQSK